MDDTGAATLMTMHPNKRNGSFRDRVSGSASVQRHVSV